MPSNRKPNSTGKDSFLILFSLLHLFFMLCLNWNNFSAKGCFTVPFAALVPGRGVSKSHIYIPLHCLWAQSSKEMHNSGRLMTWNGPHESILINWSRKDLPWKESPQQWATSLFIPWASPGAKSPSRQCRLLSGGRGKPPSCVHDPQACQLCLAPCTSHLSLSFHCSSILNLCHLFLHRGLQCHCSWCGYKVTRQMDGTPTCPAPGNTVGSSSLLFPAYLQQAMTEHFSSIPTLSWHQQAAPFPTLSEFQSIGTNWFSTPRCLLQCSGAVEAVVRGSEGWAGGSWFSHISHSPTQPSLKSPCCCCKFWLFPREGTLESLRTAKLLRNTVIFFLPFASSAPSRSSETAMFISK